MITRQLQENYKSSRTRCIPEKLIFEVTDASVVHDTNSKYVVSTQDTTVNHFNHFLATSEHITYLYKHSKHHFIYGPMII